MNILIDAFNTLFYQPLLNALVLIFVFVPGRDFGVAVIILTILIRVLLYPLNQKTIASQEKLSALAPKLKEIQKKFKDNRERIAQETLSLYKEAKVNPFSGFVVVLIQLPVLLGLYRVFVGAIGNGWQDLYSFVPQPGLIEPFFLGRINLAQPNLALAILAGAISFWQAQISAPKVKTGSKEQVQFAQIFQKQALYLFPVLTFIVLLKIPSAIGLYLIVTTAFSVLQHYAQRRRT